MDDKMLPWVALHAAGVPPRAHEEVAARGAGAVLASGFVHAQGRPVAFEPGAALRRAALLQGFSGHILGGLDRAALGMWAARRAPLCAYARGGLTIAAAIPAVAIVGPRAPSVRAARLTNEIAAAIARAGGVVVSGGAQGIDRAAHESALAAGGRTIAVLGEPVALRDERRRWMHDLFDGAPERALSVTTSGPWVGHSDRLFVARNHHIAALAQAVLVVEGAVGSGTRHTAEAARRLGIPIWAIVGDTDASAVPNALVDAGRAQALNPLRAVEQLLALDQAPVPAITRARPPEPVEADPLVRALLVSGGRALIDALARSLGTSARDVLTRATLLEMEGRLRCEGQWLVSLV
jgi:DNA processing protein